MKVHIFQHVPFEGIGSMETWFAQRGAKVQYTRFYQSPELPDPGDPDLLIVMGGPMSVNEEQKYPWLIAEKQFVRDAIQRELPIIGVCLGAQIIASALGARVYLNAEKEIGWFPIEATDAPGQVFRFPGQITVFHWHGETFDLPPGTVHLARSVACDNQAFQIGKNVVGLQFHLETTPDTADLLLQHGREELIDGRYIQKEETMRAVPEAAYARINQIMSDLLAYVMQ